MGDMYDGYDLFLRQVERKKQQRLQQRERKRDKQAIDVEFTDVTAELMLPAPPCKPAENFSVSS